ncbi:hypothetical protein SELMODRAFT_448406 [Selaginella moellendorffii]|uniref:Tify domain-containing protein n=1 Tax=Selaginella moellendorffii TaxID=88036 RepID=D8T727_SELML|nr:hypothetical protein SELMODRAFT_448406 [Selaginella moellendorffii]
MASGMESTRDLSGGAANGSRVSLQLDGDGEAASLSRLQQMSRQTGFQLAAAFGSASSSRNAEHALSSRQGFGFMQSYMTAGVCNPGRWSLRPWSHYKTTENQGQSVLLKLTPNLPHNTDKTGDLSLSLGPPSSSSSPPTPKQPAFSGEFTMLYDGKVAVYESMPIDKAQAIMLLAGSVASGSSETAAAAVNLLLSANNISQSSSSNSKCSALPQARKASLQRFLEKRKESQIKEVISFSSSPPDAHRLLLIQSKKPHLFLVVPTAILTFHARAVVVRPANVVVVDHRDEELGLGRGCKLRGRTAELRRRPAAASGGRLRRAAVPGRGGDHRAPAGGVERIGAAAVEEDPGRVLEGAAFALWMLLTSGSAIKLDQASKMEILSNKAEVVDRMFSGDDGPAHMVRLQRVWACGMNRLRERYLEGVETFRRSKLYDKTSERLFD